MYTEVFVVVVSVNFPRRTRLKYPYKFLNILKKYDVESDEGRISALRDVETELAASGYTSVERDTP